MRLAREALGMLQPRHRLFDFDARLADHGPEGHGHLLAGGHAHLPAQRDHRIEHEAGAAGQPGAGLQRRRIGDRAAAADEGAPVGLGFGGALRAGAVLDEMRQLDDRFVGRARTPPREDHAVVGADLGLHEHLREGGMGAVGVFGRQRQLGKRRHLDVAVGVAVVPDGDAPALAIALRIRRCIRPRSGSRRRS